MMNLRQTLMVTVLALTVVSQAASAEDGFFDSARAKERLPRTSLALLGPAHPKCS
jgi:hypothetical protein